MIGIILGKLKNKKTLAIVIIVALLLIIVISSMIKSNKSSDVTADAESKALDMIKNAPEGDDNAIVSMQSSLESSFGKAPSGFLWDVDGTLLSLGDSNMSAEDVLYAYFKGLSSLDMSTVAKYSRGSSVSTNYSLFFDATNKNTDYTDQFSRNMYKSCLLSLQVLGIDSVSVFAENKKVFTVNVKIIDLTDKDFWKPNQMEIYKNLYLYSNTESDTTKGDIYLYDYILKYYQSTLVKYRTAKFDVTVQKYPDLKSGWLISIDTDVDSACKYKDGKIVVSYIKELYRSSGAEIIKQQIKNEG